MKICCYDSGELEYLHALVETLLTEAKDGGLDVSAEEIIERLYDLADEGVRDLQNFREIIFKAA